MAETAEVGTAYEVEIVEEISNEWAAFAYTTEPLGIAYIGDVTSWRIR